MRAFALLLSLFLLVGPVAAQSLPGTSTQSEDQSENQSEKLDRLFGKLRGKATAAEAFSTESKIWGLWMSGGSETENAALQSASTAMSIGDFRQSESMLNSLISTTKQYPEAYNKRATLYFMMGRYNESLADIVTTLELEPRHFGALSGRGMIYQKLGKDREAKQAYEDALAINPNLPGASFAVKQLEKTVPEL